MDIYGRSLQRLELSAGAAAAGSLQLELPEKGIYFVVLREHGSGKEPIVKKVIRN